MRSEDRQDAVTVRSQSHVRSGQGGTSGAHRSTQATAAGRHHRSDSGRRLTPKKTAALAAGVAMVVSGSVLALDSAGNATPQANLTVLASDAMNRTLAVGLGSADRGGAYALSNPTRTAVSGGVGRLTMAAPGVAVEAALPVSSADVRMRATFAVNTVPNAGGGVYLEQELRRVSAGSTYRSRIRILPGGKATLGFSEVIAGGEHLLGGEKTLPFTIAAGQHFVLESEVTGTNPVQLSSRAWLVGQQAPDFVQTYSDSASTRLTAAAGVGVWTYLSGAANRGVISTIDDLAVWHVTYTTVTPPSSSASCTPSGTEVVTRSCSTDLDAADAAGPAGRQRSDDRRLGPGR